MKKILTLSRSLRWPVFLTLLVFFTGCAEWDFFRWMSGDPDAPQPSGLPRGCRGRSIEEGGTFGPFGYEALMGPYHSRGIFTRDMGFAVDEPHYIPIAREKSSN